MSKACLEGLLEPLTGLYKLRPSHCYILQMIPILAGIAPSDEAMFCSWVVEDGKELVATLRTALR